MPVQFADFAIWQRRRLDPPTMQRLLGRWVERLKGVPEEISLPLDHPRPKVASSVGGEEPLALPRSVMDSLRALGRSEGSTDFMVVLALLKVLLHAVSGDEDLCVGANAAFRGHLDAEPLIGFFVNQVALRTRPRGEDTFRQFLRQVRSVVADAFDDQELPFDVLVQAMRPDRISTVSPLFQVKIDFRDEEVADSALLADFEITTLDPEAIQAHFDLSLLVQAADGGLEGGFNYRAELFEPGTVRELARAFEMLATSVAEAPDQSLQTLRAKVDEERTRLRQAQRDELAARGRQRLRARRSKSLPV
jgi:non-ribosomal peptide synthetase component F